MNRAGDIVAKRQSLARKYDQAFESLGWLRTPLVHHDQEHGYQSYPCLFMPEEIERGNITETNHLRNQWMDHLQKNGISTRPATHAVHLLNFYKEKYQLKPEDFPNAYAADQCSISLPLFHGLTEEEQLYVIDKVLEYKN
jgi:dTDP-4-amino-4,6-dideoxygalactose transaminase